MKAGSRAGRPGASVRFERLSSKVIPISAARDAVRWTRIESARARIAAGWYERDDVQAQLAEAVFEELQRRD